MTTGVTHPVLVAVHGIALWERRKPLVPVWVLQAEVALDTAGERDAMQVREGYGH